jgi:hypothetical protein
MSRISGIWPVDGLNSDSDATAFPYRGHSMNFVQAVAPLVVILAGWVNRRQQEAIDYLRTENQILKEVCGERRIRLTDGQRRLLAIKGKLLGRKLLGDVNSIVTPDTILR